ncbi:HD domain-containing protein [Clostridium estertheticum]|uniref:HD domain-containing protein n=1 Tax=Clostridium estertheticum TaxID=238834 RepID=A0AA47I8K4_9CLOT|nr:HD domain-containing protein [Clostridium estertheticum]WAG61539.1 HD domain-containing protein [Clostridium estertheticum]
MKNDGIQGLPMLYEAKIFLEDAGRLNPGPWINHSEYVAEAARLIAEKTEGLNSETAYILGLLHDVGRREGVTDMHHIISGYNFLKEKGFNEAARICITHPFLVKEIECYSGKWDCSESEIEFIKEYLRNIEFNEYDKLIQFCDAIAISSGFCLVEKRMIDVALRYGINDLIIDKWKSTMEIKQYFESKIGKSIYTLLPGVIENTFAL